MSAHDLSRWQHAHDFGASAAMGGERRTRWVLGLTFATMLVELATGWLSGSMALLADGWHMASHVGALGLAVYAYRFARHHADDARFTFGTGRVTALAGYSSALVLAMVALWMAVEAAGRLLQPVEVYYAEAMIVAVLGLLVNLASAWLLGGADGHHQHAHAHDHDHDHDHRHVDHNLRAAYLHVLADALTSLLAIVALGAGMLMGWGMLDPLMGLVGAAVIGRWAWGLARDSSHVLLDADASGEAAQQVRRIIDGLPDHEVADLHLWQVGAASRACILSLVTHSPRPVQEYRELLAAVPGLDHLTVEINHCRDRRCGAPARG